MNAPQQDNIQVAVPAQLVVALLQYLGMRPMNEVEQMVQALRQCPQANVLPADPEKPA